MINTSMYWIHTITPLHVGAGRGVDFVDLPIMREKTTGWPIVPGSGIKGVWRDHFFNSIPNKELIDTAFGKGSDGENEFAGSMVVTDARIVLLPVRSFYGTFAYVTSPLALLRLKRDLENANRKNIPDIPVLSDTQIFLAQNRCLSNANKVYLEELDYGAQVDSLAPQWANYLAEEIFSEDWKNVFKQRFAILPDNSFDFFCQVGTEVNTRIRIDDETKIVAGTALWQEESLPAETVLAGLVWCDKVFGNGSITPEDVLSAFCKNEISCQIGGKSSIGKGQVCCRFGK